MNKAIRDCVKGTNAEKVKAAQLAKDYHSMLLDAGEIDRAPQRIETDNKWSDVWKEVKEEENELGKGSNEKPAQDKECQSTC